MSLNVLDRQLYTEAEAARLLSVSQSALHYWLEGGERRGKSYQPIIRPAAHGHRAPVTWAEFVEAGLLRAYRRDAQVPMRELRTFIQVLRQELGVPYPLADRRPYVSGRALVMEAQEKSDLSSDYWLVGEIRGQLSLLSPADAFFRRVIWDGDVAGSWRVAGEDSPVQVDPEVRFGRPSISGISTEVIWEHHQVGESDEEIAEAFDVELEAVDWALSYERAGRASRAA